MAIQNSQRFAEIEFCLQHYFDRNMAPIMQSVQKDLGLKQTKELSEYQRSFTGILADLAAGMSKDIYYDPTTRVKILGEWNSKTTEDYIALCRDKITKNTDIQHDLSLLANEWRDTVIKEIGRERYDTLSKSLNCDLALAYVDYRTNQQMIDYMVSKEMPRSSLDYIIRKGTKDSLLGVAAALTRSPLQLEIERLGETTYLPSKSERGVGKALAFGTDVLALGCSSWSGMAKLGATEVLFDGAETLLEKKRPDKTTSVEECISIGLFGSDANLFPDIKKDSKKIIPYENKYLLEINNALKNHLPVISYKPSSTDWLKENEHITNPIAPNNYIASSKYSLHNIPQFADAPGQHTPETASVDACETIEIKGNDKRDLNDTENKGMEIQGDDKDSLNEEARNQQTNNDGWSDLLQNFGLGGITDTMKHLPYIIAMLPEMLLGLFTGKTESVGFKKSLIPIASIVMGIFVKNPIMKMLLIGMGGANLFNKIGHETIEKDEGVQYKRYEDEDLNPRISNPSIQGTTLVASIDNIPCSVTITDAAAKAYAAGALPLNTLANAVLEKYDKSYSTNNTRNIDIDTSVNRDRSLSIR